MIKPLNDKKVKYALFFVLTAYFIIAIGTLVLLPQTVGFDPGLCLKMTDNAQKHIPFNNYAHPKLTDINKDEFEFVTWWSPGQFVLPLVIQKCFDIKISIALKILTFICLFFSAWGIFKLYYQLLLNKQSSYPTGISTTTLSLAFLIFTIFQPYFWSNLYNYGAGDVLLLAYCPWFIYGVTQIKRINFYSLSTLLVAGLIGFFLKISFTSIFMGALLYLFISLFVLPYRSPLNLKKIIAGGFYCFIVFWPIFWQQDLHF